MRSSWWAYKVHVIYYIHHRNKREAHHLYPGAIFQSPPIIVYADMNITSLAECTQHADSKNCMSIYIYDDDEERELEMFFQVAGDDIAAFR